MHEILHNVYIHDQLISFMSSIFSNIRMNKVQLPAIECICIRFINNKLENAQTRIFSEFDSKLYKYQHLSIECFFCNPPNPETINNFKKKKKKRCSMHSSLWKLPLGTILSKIYTYYYVKLEIIRIKIPQDKVFCCRLSTVAKSRFQIVSNFLAQY